MRKEQRKENKKRQTKKNKRIIPQSCRAISIPIQQAATLTKTESNIFTPAFIISPLLIKLTVSNEKVEKVVNAPKKPIIKKARNSGPTIIRSMRKTAKIPMAKEPATLTTNVPYGNERPKTE